MKRKFTKSIDGIERCTINIPIRLTRDDLAILENNYKKEGYKSPKDYLDMLIAFSDWRELLVEAND